MAVRAKKCSWKVCGKVYQYLNNLKDKYIGGVCVVIGNGPSLRSVPDDFLRQYHTFGSNRVYLRFVPDFYVVVNPLVIEQNRQDIEALDATKFVREGMGLTGYQLRKGLKAPFSREPDKWVNEGYTVTHVSLQLAYWMGFATVLLVGVDHRYTFAGDPNETLTMSGDDPNHFDPAYFRGQRWQAPDLMKSETYYRHAEIAYREAGRKIINLGPDSDLTVFEKGRIEEWI